MESQSVRMENQLETGSKDRELLKRIILEMRADRTASSGITSIDFASELAVREDELKIGSDSLKAQIRRIAILKRSLQECVNTTPKGAGDSKLLQAKIKKIRTELQNTVANILARCFSRAVSIREVLNTQDFPGA